MAKSRGKAAPNPLANGISPAPANNAPDIAHRMNGNGQLKPKPEETMRQDSTLMGIPFGMPGMPGLNFAMMPFFGCQYGQPIPTGPFGGPATPFYNGFGGIGLNQYGNVYGTFNNYWLMERNPCVALAEAVADAPVWSAELTWEYREGLDDLDKKKIEALVRDSFDAHERDALKNLTLARSWGVRQAENVFAIDAKGRFIFKKFKWLMPDLTMALRDEHGDLVGMTNQGVELDDPRRFTWLAYDSKGCNWYGRSRKENFKTQWRLEESLYAIMEYAQNVQVRPFGKVSFPYNSKEPANSPNNLQCLANAQRIASGLAAAQFVTTPNPFIEWKEEMLKIGLKPVDIEPYPIEWYDKTGKDSMAGFTNALAITNKGIVSGCLMPPRAVLEGPGTQADAETHSDTGVQVNENFLGMLCETLSKGVIDTVIVQNMGEDYRGAVKRVPSPLVDKQMTFNNDLVKLVLGSDIGKELMKRVVPLAPIFEKSGVKINDFNQEKLADDVEAKAAEDRAMELKAKAPAGKPKKLSIGPHKFSSTQIQLDDKAADEIRTFGATIPTEELAEDGVETDIHVTVKYGIHTDDVSEIEDALHSWSGKEAMYLVGKTSLFPATEDHPYDVLKMNVISGNLHELNRLISDSVECTDTYPVYKPHVTVAYLKAGEGKKYVGRTLIHGDWRRASVLAFSDKAGTRYPVRLAGPIKASLAVESTTPIDDKEKKRRKAFLFALLAFFAWQQDQASMGATAPYVERLATILRDHMTEAAHAVAESAPIAEAAKPMIAKQANALAIKINETTSKQIITAQTNGATLEEAVKKTLGKSIETRASVIEDDMTFLAGQIVNVAGAAISQRQLIWICADDEKVCPVCSKLDGVVVEAGQPFADGVYLPVVDTHSFCRCKIGLVPEKAEVA